MLIHGDALHSLQALPSETVQCIVTSPPYFSQRDYGTPEQIWPDHWIGSLGEELTVKRYAEHLVSVFAEARRVLRLDGVLYLNLGDTYYSAKGRPHGRDTKQGKRQFSRSRLRAVDMGGWDIPRKSLLGVPWVVALRLQNDGWTLRSAIIWHRPNCLAEPSGNDRPHRKYEHVFLFAKSERYYYDRSALNGEEDVWRIPVAPHEINTQAAPFPEALAARCILTGSRPGDTVLDPFSGSGTTGYAAKRYGREYIGIELNEETHRQAERRLARIPEETI